MFEFTVRARHAGRGLWTILVIFSLLTIPAADASATPGYEPDAAKPSIDTAAEIPRGVAVDQASQMLYVAELTTDQTSAAPGEVEQLDSNGIPTPNSPFGSGSGYFAGVAVNPVTQGIYAYQVQLVTAVGTLGSAAMNTFSSTGVQEASLSPPKSRAPQLATDAAGDVYLPNNSTASIQVFDPSGSLKESIQCIGCPGGEFVEPVSVALDSVGNLYAVDLRAARVIKFKQSSGAYVYDSTLQSGRGAAAVGVDPADNSVFVGDFSGTYHIVAYDSSGAQIDDFGEGRFASPPFGAISAGQIAVNKTTRKVYIADPGVNKVLIFDRVSSIPGPAVSTEPATSVGQVEADINSTVNPHGHGLTSCTFRYTDNDDYQAHAFANATVHPCSSLPGGSVPAQVSARLSGLTPATKYAFQVSAESNGGSAEGMVRNFTTLPPLPPEVTTGSPSSITQTMATIAGMVNPEGGPISDCHLEYISQAGFDVSGFNSPTSIQCSPKKPSGTTDVTVSAKVSGLTPGTEYRFRVVASNNSGTSIAADKGFTTPADTCATKSDLCPPPEEPPIQTPAVSVTAPALFLPAPPSTPAPVLLKCRKGFKKRQVHGKSKCARIRKRHKRPPSTSR